MGHFIEINWGRTNNQTDIDFVVLWPRGFMTLQP
jgi:hypothetical protein